MQHGGGLLKKATLKRGERCLPCYRRKVRCSVLPCARCFEMCLQCQPQWAVGPDRPFVDIAMSMLETDTFSNDCIEILWRCHGQGYLDRTALSTLVCSWRHMIRVWGADRTQDLCKAVCNAFDTARDEMPPNTLQGALPQETPATAELRQQLMRTQTFTLLDDGASVLMAETLTGTGVAFAMNSASKTMLCSDLEADDLLTRHQLLPIHLLACMLDPEARMCLLKPYFELCSTARRNGCAFVKFCERDGTTDLNVLRWRYLELPDSPGSLTVAFTLQRAPKTRYLTRRPGHRYRWVEQFKRKRQDGCEAAGSPSIPTLPAIACLPLAFDVSVNDLYASTDRDVTQGDTRLTGRRKLLEQWAAASSPTSTTQASAGSSSSIAPSALSTVRMASGLDVRTDSECPPPLCWSSRPPSPIPRGQSEPSSSSSPSTLLSVSVSALTSASPHTSQFTSLICASAPPTSPPGLLLRLAHLQAQLPTERLPSSRLSTLVTATSTLTVPTPPAVPMGAMWLINTTSSQQQPMLQHAVAAPRQDLHHPGYVSEAVAPVTTQEAHEEEDDDVLQAMRWLIN